MVLMGKQMEDFVKIYYIISKVDHTLFCSGVEDSATPIPNG